jgi:hypothetical protein
MYYLLLYDLVDQFAERRPPYRDAHLKLARAAADNGELLLGGAFADPVDGAALVFKAADQSVAEHDGNRARIDMRRMSGPPARRGAHRGLSNNGTASGDSGLRTRWVTATGRSE